MKNNKSMEHFLDGLEKSGRYVAEIMTLRDRQASSTWMDYLFSFQKKSNATSD